MMPRFDLSGREKKIVIQIIKNHGFFHNTLDNPEDDLNEKVERFRKKHPNIFLEIALLTIADILGSQLKQNNPKGFSFKTDFLNKILQSR